MVRGFNINGADDDDEIEQREHQDIINLFYRVGKEKIPGLKTYPKRGKATLDYDVEYLNLLFRGHLYGSSVQLHPDIPKDPPPRFVFDFGDIQTAIARYHKDGYEGNLLPASQNLCLHEFFLRKHGSQKRIKILAPFLFYFFENRNTPLYSDLDDDSRHLIDYVVREWKGIEGAKPIENLNDLSGLPALVDEFIQTFGDVIPLRQRYGVYGDYSTWPLSCCELLLDDYLDCMRLLGGTGVYPGSLTSRKIWGKMFMRELRSITGLGDECLPNWDDLSDVDTSNCWCTRV